MSASLAYEAGTAVLEAPPAPTRTEVTSPEAAAEVLRALEWSDSQEECWALLLDTKHRLLEPRLISRGSVDHTFMDPASVFRAALTTPRCSALVLAHNHPSGDLTPSADDMAVTRRLDAAGDLVAVNLLDHLVVSTSPFGWVSLARRGVL